jgi:tRNA-specific 2-thiouridylase
MSRIVLAMSGGVDSSVAAHLLVEQGHEVIGVFMRHGEEALEVCATGNTSLPSLPIANPRGDHKQGCCTATDAADARRVADRLGIPFYALNLQAEFARIIDYFVDEYSTGRTPNPCVMCNNWIKFGKLCDYADSLDAEYIATGHYARIVQEKPTDEPALWRGRDLHKDQSYALFGIRRDVLKRTLLPVGGYQKPEIRSMAQGLGLRVADKRDSQEICFVPDGDHASLVRRWRGSMDLSGEIVTTDGTVLGRHEGIENYTIGQRKGLGIALGDRRYVVRIDRQRQQVVIGSPEDLLCEELWARDANWLVDRPQGPLRCTVKIRYGARPVGAIVLSEASGQLHVRFDNPQSGVAPGQAVVCYDEMRVLGGGWIHRSSATANGSSPD